MSPVAHRRDPAAVLPGRGGAGAASSGSRTTAPSRWRARSGSPPARPTTCSTARSGSPAPTRAASPCARRSTFPATSRRAARPRSTATRPPRGAPPSATPPGQWVEVQTPQPITFDHLDLQVVADGRHSVPTQVRIDAGGESRTVDLPAIDDSVRARRAPRPCRCTFAPLTGDDVRVTVTGVRPVDDHRVPRATSRS